MTPCHSRRTDTPGGVNIAYGARDLVDDQAAVGPGIDRRRLQAMPKAPLTHELRTCREKPAADCLSRTSAGCMKGGRLEAASTSMSATLALTPGEQPVEARA